MDGGKYSYPKINAIKIIIKSDSNKILLIKEPETNEWMPGHWGFPGGKTFEKESLYLAFKRKVKGDLGLDLEPQGILRVEELLMDGKTILIFHALAYSKDEAGVEGEVAGYRWVTKEEVEKMDLTEFTEYFSKQLLLNFFSNNLKIVDFDLIETQNYFEMEGNPDYQRWLKSGKKGIK